MMSIKQTIRKMSKKDLLYFITKLRTERQNTRYVSQKVFWRGHIRDLRAELIHRKKLGLIKKSAGAAIKRRR